jgi:4-hydroxy-tetrahydrodipicolinate synthase
MSIFPPGTPDLGHRWRVRLKWGVSITPSAPSFLRIIVRIWRDKIIVIGQKLGLELLWIWHWRSLATQTILESALIKLQNRTGRAYRPPLLLRILRQECPVPRIGALDGERSIWLEKTMFKGLSAFPLTPFSDEQVDEAAYVRLVQRLVDAGVDSIGALGSTGSYAYLTREDRATVARLAVENAGDVPVIVGVGGLRTAAVLAYADDAQKAGAKALLFATVTRHISVPLVVYDNPGTTNFVFGDDLYKAIANLPNVSSIKIPGVPVELDEARSRIQALRTLLPSHVEIGVSGDAVSTTGLNAGCDVWYSVIGGLFPKTALSIVRASQAGNAEEASRIANHLEPLWSLFARHGGSLRVVAAAAELLGLVSSPSLPRPLKAIGGQDRQELGTLLKQLQLDS